MTASFVVENDVPLAPFTTLELGGPARYFTVVRSVDALREALLFAREHRLSVGILGGGSNLIVSDAGFHGLVVQMALEGVTETTGEDGRVLVTAQAGEPWDPFVARMVEKGYAGLECLSGIPGRVGATPIQNVGAYGQEVGDSIAAVHVLNRQTLETETLAPEQCEFSYRDSAFKANPERYVVVSVTFALTPNGAPTIRYAELERALGDDRSLSHVRDTVIALRRRKSMVIDPEDPNHRSAGSFFMNPVIDKASFLRFLARAMKQGLIQSGDEVPRWPQGERVKLAAGWLIERSGIHKGMRSGTVGVSTNHALALVHHGGGSTSDLMTLAAEIRQSVALTFGIKLVPEPVRWGV